MINVQEQKKCNICGEIKHITDFYKNTSCICKKCRCALNTQLVLDRNMRIYPDLPNEVWVDVVGYEGFYKVSNIGRIRSFVRGGRLGCVLKQCTHRQGYKEVRLTINKKGKMFLVHRLVADAFIPNPDNKETVNHKDGDKANNRVENLEWATINENIAHAFRTGLREFPEARRQELYNGRKLSKQDVIDIREEFSNGSTQKELAEKYCVSTVHICKIVNNKIRTHVNG